MKTWFLGHFQGVGSQAVAGEGVAVREEGRQQGQDKSIHGQNEQEAGGRGLPQHHRGGGEEAREEEAAGGQKVSVQQASVVKG